MKLIYTHISLELNIPLEGWQKNTSSSNLPKIVYFISKGSWY